ncbi:helix-turn-helix domain-containing protein [Microbacterium sp. NPDC055357]|mgnify:FL=1
MGGPHDALDALFANLPETLTVKEVSALVRKTPQGVYSMLKAGKIPGYEVAGGWIIIRDELKEQMRRGSSREQQTTED